MGVDKVEALYLLSLINIFQVRRIMPFPSRAKREWGRSHVITCDVAGVVLDVLQLAGGVVKHVARVIDGRDDLLSVKKDLDVRLLLRVEPARNLCVCCQEK